jgi:hypothetical protein
MGVLTVYTCWEAEAWEARVACESRARGEVEPETLPGRPFEVLVREDIDTG